MYVDAPHTASGDIPEDVAANFSGPFFEWWNHRKDEDNNAKYDGFEESESFVRRALQEHVSTIHCYVQMTGMLAAGRKNICYSFRKHGPN